VKNCLEQHLYSAKIPELKPKNADAKTLHIGVYSASKMTKQKKSVSKM
jgi:hypothetical protein